MPSRNVTENDIMQECAYTVPGSQWTKNMALVPLNLHLGQKTLCQAALLCLPGACPSAEVQCGQCGLHGPSSHGHILLPSWRAHTSLWCHHVLPCVIVTSDVSLSLTGEALLGAKTVSRALRTVLPPQA